MTKNEHLGKITRLVATGLGYIREEGPNGGIFCFTSDKIEGYHQGETPGRLEKFSPRGLKEGALVKFEIELGAVKIIRPLNF